MGFYLDANAKLVVELVTIGTAATVTTGCVETVAFTATGLVSALVVVDALVVVVVEDVAFGTAATVASHQVLTPLKKWFTLKVIDS